MIFLRKLGCSHVFYRITSISQKVRHLSLYPRLPPQPELEELCNLISTTLGSLDDLESGLNKCRVPLTSSVVIQVVDHCKAEAHTRRLLRFFTWSSQNLKRELEDKDYNHAIRVFAERKDHRAIQILLSDLRREQRALERQTFSVVADTLVKLGKEDDALGIFKNLNLFNCPQDEVTVTAIVTALCAKGHAKRAAGVVLHHKDKISSVESCIYKSLLYGWSVQENVKEARNVLQEMKSKKIVLDLYCYNTFLRCICEHNLDHNASGLVPEALNVMIEMKSYNIIPTSISYNILLSCLCRARRVQESLRILDFMRKSGCSPDWMSYYLVTKVLYLTGRFGKGNQLVDVMMEERLLPTPRFYYDLIGILCGVERVNYALELFERMKRNSVGDYGPVYDVLIPKLCRSGDFEKGKQLWDEALEMGVSVSCSKDILDPSKTEVFLPKRKEEEKVMLQCSRKQESGAQKSKMIAFPKGKKVLTKTQRKHNKQRKKKEWRKKNSITS